MAIRRAIDDRWGIAQSLIILGDLASATDDSARAWSCYRDGLAIYEEIGNRLGVVEGIERLARLMAGRQSWIHAARCFGAVSAVRERIGAPILPVDRPAVDQAIADARAALGDGLFTATWNAGRAMETDEMIAEATQQATTVIR